MSSALLEDPDRDELVEDCVRYLGRLAAGEWFGGWKWRARTSAFESTGTLGWKAPFQVLLDRTQRAF